jgi:DNA-binding NarL/FixJ family response regulator
MTNDLIRIILVDDHKQVRESWKMLLETIPVFSVIGICDNGKSALEMCARLLPDIILVDINMKPMNGFTFTEEISKTKLPVKVIGLSVNNQKNYAEKMLALGARGYFTKTSSLEEIAEGIIKVYNGETYICTEVSSKLNQH